MEEEAPDGAGNILHPHNEGCSRYRNSAENVLESHMDVKNERESKRV